MARELADCGRRDLNHEIPATMRRLATPTARWRRYTDRWLSLSPPIEERGVRSCNRLGTLTESPLAKNPQEHESVR
jgi:hypothetical protein